MIVTQGTYRPMYLILLATFLMATLIQGIAANRVILFEQ